MTYHDIPINDKTVLLVLSCFRIWVFSVSHSPQAIPGGGNPFRKTRRHVVWTARGRKQRKFRSKPKQNYCTKTISQKVFQVTFLRRISRIYPSRLHLPKNCHENHEVPKTPFWGFPNFDPNPNSFGGHQPGVSANLSASSTSCEAVACKADLHRNSSALYDIMIWYVTRNIAYFRNLNFKTKPHQTVAPSQNCQYFHKWFLASSFAGHPGRNSFY